MISKKTNTSSDYLYLVCHTPTLHSINIQCKEQAIVKSNYGAGRPQEITEHIISKACWTSLLKEAAQIKLLNYPWNESPVMSLWWLKLPTYSKPKDSMTLKG